MSASKSLVGAAETYGVADVIAKPFNIDALLSALSAHASSGRPATLGTVRG